MKRKVNSKLVRTWFFVTGLASMYWSHEQYIQKDAWLMWFWVFMALLNMTAYIVEGLKEDS